MSSTLCQTITERIAAGEALAPAQAEHVEACPACARLATLPGLVARAARKDATPAPGFASRMTAGAQARYVVRRRNRVVRSVAAAAAVLVLGAGVGSWAHERAEQRPAAVTMPIDYGPWPARDDAPTTTVEQDLVGLLDVDGALEYSARWDTIEEPLAPIRDLLKNSAKTGEP
jgi:hypothetical protein